MECLSDELLLLLFSYVAVNSSRDLLSICCTCRGFNRVGADPTLWRIAASKHLQVEIFSFNTRLITQQKIEWKRLFVDSMYLQQTHLDLWERAHQEDIQVLQELILQEIVTPHHPVYVDFDFTRSPSPTFCDICERNGPLKVCSCSKRYCDSCYFECFSCDTINCIECNVHCEKCLKLYCRACSVTDYETKDERFFCVDCYYSAKSPAKKSRISITNFV